MREGSSWGFGPRAFAGRLLWIVLGGVALRVAYVLIVERGDPLGGDALYYHHAANLLADGKGFPEPFRYLYGGAQEFLFVPDDSLITTTEATRLPVGHIEATAGHPPSWVVVLAAASFLGVTSVLGHQLVAAAVGGLGVAAVGYLGRELAGDRVGLIAAGLAAGYAFIWLSDGLIMSETLVVPVAAVMSLAAVRFARLPSWRSAAVFGAIGALGALTRAELALFLPVVAAWVLLRSSLAWTDRVRLYGVAGVVAVLLVAPWVGRNLATFEEPVFLSNGSGIVLAQANCDATYFGDKQGSWEYQCGLPQPVSDDGSLLDESQRDVEFRERGLEYIGDHRGRLVTHVVPKRVARLWGLYEPVQQLRADILVEGRTFKLSVLGLVQFYALVPLAALGAWILRSRGGPLAPVAAWPVLVTFTAALAFATTRYRAAAEVSLVVLAAVAIDAYLARSRPVTNVADPGAPAQ